MGKLCEDFAVLCFEYLNGLVVSLQDFECELGSYSVKLISCSASFCIFSSLFILLDLNIGCATLEYAIIRASLSR